MAAEWMRLAEIEPSPRLKPFVSSYWFYLQLRPQNRKLRFIPTGGSFAVLPYDAPVGWEGPAGSGTISEPSVVGVWDRWLDLVVEPGSGVVLVHFEEAGLAAFSAGTAAAAAGAVLPLAGTDLAGLSRAAETLSSSLGGRRPVDLEPEPLRDAFRPAAACVERLLSRALVSGRGVDAGLLDLARLMAEAPGAATVRAALDLTGLSASRLNRSLAQALGVRTKRFLMIRRAHRLYRRIMGAGRIDFTDEALGLGYYDQAHAIHDLSRATGFTPRYLMDRIVAAEEALAVGLSHAR